MVAYLALFVALGGTAYAVDTVGSSDVINESLLSEDFKNGEVKQQDLANGAVTGGKLAANSVITPKLADGAVTGAKVLDDTAGGGLGAEDLASGSVTGNEVLNSSLTGSDVETGSIFSSDIANDSLSGSDVGNNSLTGLDIFEASLIPRDMGCQIGLVQAFARVKGGSAMPSTYTDSSTWSDTKNSCSGGTIQVRRQSTGQYFVRFNGLAAKLAVAISNSDGYPPNSPADDNVVSINKITGGADIGSFRVEVEDVTGSGTSAEDGWFTIIVV